MNSIIRNLIIAAPLAAAAIAAVPAGAMASEPGPVIIVQPTDPDPEPVPDDKAPAPKPSKPKGPGDIAPAPKPSKPKGPGDIAPAPKPAGPQGPGDIAPAPKPTGPKGPDDITNPAPCPTHGVDCTTGDDSDEEIETVPAAEKVPTDEVDSISLPTRVDAGLAADGEQDGLELTWLLVGGAIVSASGVAFAARQRMRRTA